MRVGIIAEGRTDFAVVANILQGKLGVARHKLTPLRPRFALDETDRAGRGVPDADSFSNYETVLAECSAPHEKLLDFLDTQILGPRFVVVHIDTDRCDAPGFGVARPEKKPKAAGESYSATLRERVAARLDALLGPELRRQVCLAVAVEETEAWILTLWDAADLRDTGLRGNPKKYLMEKVVGDAMGKQPPRPRAKGETEHDYFDFLSAGFRDAAVLVACGGRSQSLAAFLGELNERLPDAGSASGA